MNEETMIEKLIRKKEEMTPKTGFNVVGIDKFEMPGDELYLIKHVDTKEEAIEVKASSKSKDDIIIL